MIKLKRVYEEYSSSDGPCYLVERLWPRGVKKASLRLDSWLKDAAPSAELRKWFGHDPERWQEFRRRYFAELDQAPGAWKLIALAARNGEVTLLYSSHDTEHNNAVALRDYIEQRAKGFRRSTPQRQKSAKGAARTTEPVKEQPVPHSILREPLKSRKIAGRAEAEAKARGKAGVRKAKD